MFPTEQVGKTAQETAQQQETDNEQEDREMRDFWPVESIEQLYQSMLIPAKNFGFETINDYMAAGFLLPEELDVIRELSRAIQADKQLQKILGNVKLTRATRIKLNSLLTIAHSSKSREGAAYETLITQKSKNFQKFKDDTNPDKTGGWGFGGRKETPDLGLQIPRQEDVAPNKRQGF